MERGKNFSWNSILLLDFLYRGLLAVATLVSMTKIQITMAMLGKAKQVILWGKNEDSGQTVNDVLD